MLVLPPASRSSKSLCTPKSHILQILLLLSCSALPPSFLSYALTPSKHTHARARNISLDRFVRLSKAKRILRSSIPQIRPPRRLTDQPFRRWVGTKSHRRRGSRFLRYQRRRRLLLWRHRRHRWWTERLLSWRASVLILLWLIEGGGGHTRGLWYQRRREECIHTRWLRLQTTIALILWSETSSLRLERRYSPWWIRERAGIHIPASKLLALESRSLRHKSILLLAREPRRLSHQPVLPKLLAREAGWLGLEVRILLLQKYPLPINIQ